VPADVKPIYARVTRHIRPLSEAQDESTLVAVWAIYWGSKGDDFWRRLFAMSFGPKGFKAIVAFEYVSSRTSAILGKEKAPSP